MTGKDLEFTEWCYVCKSYHPQKSECRSREEISCVEWDEVYAGYVILDREKMFYIVINDPDVYGVALRRHASRFTKKEALTYISEKRVDNFIVEDAK